jgi:hypothetical protein
MRRATPKLAVPILTVVFLLVGLPQLRSQTIDWNNPVAPQEMQSFQLFLTNHPWIADKLRDDPSLANNAGFLRRSPELQHFLNAHPFVQASFKSDAKDVMSRAQQGDGTSRNNAANYQEMQDFQLFLKNHPWIAGKLREKPSLANDKGFLKGNHELPEFLNSHPYVQSQFRADAGGFMQRAQAFAAEASRHGADDPHAADYESLRMFLQNHQWIADKLKENPSRATNKGFLNESKELRQFLEAHPYLQDQLKQDARRTLDQALQPGGEFL